MSSLFGYDLGFDFGDVGDVVKVGSALWNTYSGGKANDAQLKEQQRLQNLQQTYDEGNRAALIQYYKDIAAQDSANSAASSAASARAAAAKNAWGAQMAAAKNAQMNNQMAAEKKANKLMNKTFNEVKGVYAPFKDTALATLPKMSHAYDGGLDLLALANDKIKAQTALLQPSKPAYMQQIPNAQNWMITPMLKAMGGR